MAYKISVEEIFARPVLSIRTQSKPEDLGSIFGAIFGEVSQYLASQDLSPAGMPFCRYHGFADGEVDIDAGLPVDEKLEGSGRIEASQLPAGRAAVTYHMGPYENLNVAHKALGAWIEENAFEPLALGWEIYSTDPREEPDPAKWRTELIRPIK